jgi:hypothetical protein
MVMFGGWEFLWRRSKERGSGFYVFRFNSAGNCGYDIYNLHQLVPTICFYSYCFCQFEIVDSQKVDNQIL